MSTYSISGNAGVADATVSYSGNCERFRNCGRFRKLLHHGLVEWFLHHHAIAGWLYILSDQRKRDGERLEYHGREFHSHEHTSGVERN